jgi:hypothetical protein
MSMHRIYEMVAVAVLTILVLSFLPRITSVGAEIGSDAVNSGHPLAQLTPTLPVPGDGPIARPPVTFDDIIVQSEDGSQDISAQSDNSGVEIVPPAAFIHTGELGTGTEGEDWYFSFFGGFVWNDSSNEVCLAAPIYLPPGSVIESFTAYMYDNSTSGDITIYFDRTSSWGGWDELARVWLSGSSDSIWIVTDPSINPDNGANVVAPDFHYHVDFCFPAGSSTDIRVYGARVDYTPAGAADENKVYLPIVMKPSNTTKLYIKNSTGGVIDYYRIYKEVGGKLLAECPTKIKNGAKVLCGSFSAGERYVETYGCGEPGTANINFPGGTCTRTVRCGRDNPTTMVCN